MSPLLHIPINNSRIKLLVSIATIHYYLVTESRNALVEPDPMGMTHKYKYAARTFGCMEIASKMVLR